jgi:hypothetical protein
MINKKISAREISTLNIIRPVRLLFINHVGLCPFVMPGITGLAKSAESIKGHCPAEAPQQSRSDRDR